MRFNFCIFILAVTCASALAQQHVLRNAVDPRPVGTPRTCAFTEFGLPAPRNPCDVIVYNTTEIESRLDTTKAAAIAECKQDIDTAKGQLATDVNKLPSAAVDALKAQIKEELKAEIFGEMLDEIKSGRLKIPDATSGTTKRK